MNTIIHRIADEPFRLFFPLGTLFCFIGILYWPLTIYNLGVLTGHSSQFHIDMQLLGFVWAFILGFLTTALPRVTDTKSVTLPEFLFLLASYALMIVFIFQENQIYVALSFLLSLVVLLTILAQRFVRRKRSPPPTFIFIPFGFLAVALGQILNIQAMLSQNLLLPPKFGLGNLLIYQCFTLLLLIGVGGYLIRSILGWAPSLPQNENEKLVLEKFKPRLYKLHGCVALLILVSFFIEYHIHAIAGELLRTLLITGELLTQTKIYKWPRSGKLTAITLYIVLWLLLIGSWVIIFIPVGYKIDLLHLIYAGGFALASFGVATRVILSHCGYSPLLKKAYLPYTIAMGLLLAGLATRVFVAAVPRLYLTHLAYAAIMWCLGLIVWSIFILGRCLKETFLKNQT